MLVEFQQALADMVASPELCRAARALPGMLAGRYDLTPVELARLTSMVTDAGMACNCILYRANRLAPIVLNLRELSLALGDDLTPLLDEYWQCYPGTDVNFLFECERFCRFLTTKRERGFPLSLGAQEAFAREYANLQLRVLASRTVLS